TAGKGIDQAFAIVVKVDAGAGADGGAGAGGVCDCQARREVVLVRGEEAGLVVVLASRSEAEKRLIDLARCSGLPAFHEPVVRVHGGKDLLPFGFPWSLKDHVAETGGDGKVRPDAPGVLNVSLELVAPEVALDGSAGGQRGGRGRRIEVEVVV